MNFLCRHVEWKLEFLPRAIHRCPRIRQNLKNLQNQLFTSSLTRYVGSCLEGPVFGETPKLCFSSKTKKSTSKIIRDGVRKNSETNFLVFIIFLKISSRDVKGSFERHAEGFLLNCLGDNRSRSERVYRL